jgi:hypothetical protein
MIRASSGAKSPAVDDGNREASVSSNVAAHAQALYVALTRAIDVK